ncbi:MAG: hypothetical protein MJY87_04165 [Fibrobacter sp.]|nr:hypothetical protein [Fibrobacter sp.]
MTAQIHERLILNGKYTTMACSPVILKKVGVVTLSNKKLRAEIAAGKTSNLVGTSVCWRGYIGTWEIKDNILFLNNLEGRHKLISPTPVFASWFTGELKIPKGRMVRYAHGGFHSLYKKELYIQIEKGKVIGKRIVRHSVILNLLRRIKMFLCHL